MIIICSFTLHSVTSQKHLIESDIRVFVKVKANGSKGKLLEWLNSFLSQRKQKDGQKSCFSSLKAILSGVPQGSVLGLLFIFCIH